MQVKDLMTTSVVSVTLNTPVMQVAELLHVNHFTGVPVVDEAGKLVGTIMERDFITADSSLYLPTYIKLLGEIDIFNRDKKFFPEEAKKVCNAKAADVMNTNLVIARPETSLQELAELFASKRVNPIPVVNEFNKLVGVISRSDLIKLFTPKQIVASRDRGLRPVDFAAGSALKRFKHTFTLVSRIRVSVWLFIAIALFIIGFVLGQAWLVSINN